MNVIEINVDDHGQGGVYAFVKRLIENKPLHVNIDIASIAEFENSANIDWFEKRMCKVYYIGYSGSKYFRLYYYYKNLIQLLKEKKYSVAHIHSDVAYLLLVFGLACKKAGIHKIILHSHAAGIDGNARFLKKLLHYLAREGLRNNFQNCVACSKLAAEWMFKSWDENIHIINNGVNINKFKYNYKIREIERRKLKIDNSFVVGHVGRFSYQKNHKFLLYVFAELLKIRKDAILLLIGEGILQEEIRNLARRLGVYENVIFYGISDKVEYLFQAMDVFVLPSHFEGLPIVGVEAQASGLPVIFSDKITPEVQLIKETFFLSIDLADSAVLWASKIKEISYYQRIDTSDEIRNKGFDLETTVTDVFKMYGE